MLTTLASAEKSSKPALVLIGSRPEGGAYEISQASPCSHWLQALGVGLMGDDVVRAQAVLSL